MAYSLPVGSVAEVTIRTTISNQTCLSVLHYLYTGTATLTDGGAALLALLGKLNSTNNLLQAYANICAANVSINECRAQAIRPFRYNPVSIAPTINSGNWVLATDCNNPSAAVAITKSGQEASRSNRGTLHMPGVPDDAMVGGRITNAYRDAADPLELQIAVNQQVTTGVTWTPIIYHRAAPTNSAVIVSVNTQDTIRTMRRRVVGRGI